LLFAGLRFFAFRGGVFDLDGCATTGGRLGGRLRRFGGAAARAAAQKLNKINKTRDLRIVPGKDRIALGQFRRDSNRVSLRVLG
jgi:hypothetical protein